MKTFLITRNDGRFYGSSLWTFDIKRALHFKTREQAEKTAIKLTALEIEIISL